MDKQELYRRAEQALNQAFEAAKKSVKLVAEKAGEAAHVTKLLVEKATLEHRVTRQFARLGGRVYDKVAREGGEGLGEDPEIRGLIEETKRLENELSRVENALDSERQQPKAGKRSTHS